MHCPNLDCHQLKRDLRQLVPFLLIGALVNIAIAWSCAMWAEIPSFHTGDRSAQENALLASWLPQKPEGFPDQDWGASIYDRGFGIRTSVMVSMPDTEYPHAPKLSETFDLDLIEAGWPSASFVGGVWTGGVDHFEPVWALVIGPQQVAPSLVHWERIIPLMPKWSGFLINTVFFGGITFLLFRWPRALRQHLRATRGLCPA
jgi:hypothetical protein